MTEAVFTDCGYGMMNVMGQQIIKQPDGRLAVFDTVSDSFIVVDADAEEITEWRAEEAAEAARERTKAELARVLDESNDHPYRQFTLTWEEASRRDRRSPADDR
ncbi:hypothetical protein [Streptomyces sp. H51]|uniref:hypothetical protein n=1 Tax=Streptomyces sp. H51 TaxID=3111770 RepID=UPI002D7A36DB|nr:hypothetical protein [Streptomyces sp. H51]